MKRAARASMAFSLQWQSPAARHNDRWFADRIDFYRDIFPGEMSKRIFAAYFGESYQESFPPGILVPPFSEKRIVTFAERQFEKAQGKLEIAPRLGRFYPQGLAWTALNCFRGNVVPFRLIGKHNGTMTADLNHPLAGYPLTLEATCIERLGLAEARGGGCNDIAEMVTTNGPGMQIPYPGVWTDFYAEYPMRRRNEVDDREFYRTPRMVQHLDDTARAQVRTIYARLLSSGTRILDLMSSWDSHLPETLDAVHVTGLGLNEAEMRANARLSESIVHDLNRSPIIPFQDRAFDAVICTASIEYLVQPHEVMREIVRVLKPGGLFVTVFSDRWFPGKEILPWSEMHPFERVGLVLDYYMQAHAFENLQTESIRGLARPTADKYIDQTAFSDPTFAVWGYLPLAPHSLKFFSFANKAAPKAPANWGSFGKRTVHPSFWTMSNTIGRQKARR
jgi:SAM-dependent methyltransferase